MELSNLLSLVLFKIGLINSILNLNLSKFFNFIMINHQSLSVISSVMKSLFCCGCRAWFLEANESKVSVFTFLKLNIFNDSKLFEQILKIVFAPLVGEVFNIKIASFLWCLISKSIFLFLYISFNFFHGWANVKFQITSFELIAIKFFDGLGGASRSVFFVYFLFIIIANESKLLTNFFVFNEDKRINVSISSKKTFNLVICHLKWNVFDVNIIYKFSDRSYVFWTEFDCLAFRSIASLFNGIVGILFFLETDKAVSIRFMIWVKWYFQRLNFSESFKMSLKISILDVFRNILNENIMSEKLFFVAS
jgi:hypothetical protein